MSFMITMSQKELHRLEVIQKIRDQRLSVVQAAELLGLSRSQMHRLLQAYDHSGAAGLVSKKRSRPSNRRHSEDFRNAALDLIRERYLDFGPTLARVTANRPLLDGFEEERGRYRQRLAEYQRRLSSYQSGRPAPLPLPTNWLRSVGSLREVEEALAKSACDDTEAQSIAA
ncbi:winged helix-turn helix protein [Rhizobium laguerreae]|uniref:Winged helix-turn helix protein n=1 Tax=Rhizobium laguerreae TaxID=1076926 RepID=A0AAX2QA14_9HYPH|nr:winged helix-turn helix protein [Rhizobium laguerreae]